MWLRRLLFLRTWSFADVLVLMNVGLFGLWWGLAIWFAWVFFIGPMLTKFFLTTDVDNNVDPPKGGGTFGKHIDGGPDT